MSNQRDRRAWRVKNSSLANNLDEGLIYVSKQVVRYQNFGQNGARVYKDQVDTDETTTKQLNCLKKRSSNCMSAIGILFAG